MKRKTSVSIDDDLLKKAGQIAEENERSKAWIIEKLIEVLVATADHNKTFSENLQRVSYEVKKAAENNAFIPRYTR
jgi:hypothetical protein